jgi:arylsulfatase A-like enzyme
VRHKTRIYHEFLAQAKQQVGDPELGLVFLHVPVPHAPHAYNRKTGQFDLSNQPLKGYIDSLALLDRMWGELRQEMEARGTWDRTTILLSADHPFRVSQAIDGKSSQRIPFLLHFPGQTKSEPFDRTFNSIISSRLVLSILESRVSDVPQALGWLEANYKETETPVPVAPH